MAARIAHIIAVAAVFNLSTLEKGNAQQTVHVNVDDSLYGESLKELRRLQDSVEEEVGHEVGNEMFVAQNQLKKATTVSQLDSYHSNQGEAVDQTRSVIDKKVDEDGDDEQK